MNETLQDRIENYLDGLLDTEESRRFEESLLDDKVARQFRELLLLRELLGTLPPDQPPPALVERIESALVFGRTDRPKKRSAPTRRFGVFMGALKAGVGWTGHVAFGMSGGSGALKGSVDAMQAIAYALGPLREPARKGIRAMRVKPKAIWKTALSKGWWRLWP